MRQVFISKQRAKKYSSKDGKIPKFELASEISFPSAVTQNKSTSTSHHNDRVLTDSSIDSKLSSYR